MRDVFVRVTLLVNALNLVCSAREVCHCLLNSITMRQQIKQLEDEKTVYTRFSHVLLQMAIILTFCVYNFRHETLIHKKN